MNTQPSLFDAPEPSPFDKGMRRSAESARKWSDSEVQAVDRAIEVCIRLLPEWTADDIWTRLPKDFPVTKGLGSRLKLFTAAGKIMPTDRTRKSTRGGDHCHGQRLTVWISL
jgi:hypothetical protein